MRVSGWLRTLCSALVMTVGWEGAWGQALRHVPSDHRGDIRYRAFSNIDGNNIRASVFNSGYSGAPREVPESVNFEWPKNTNRIYVSIVGIWVGGEVRDVHGDTVQIVDVFAWRTSPQGKSWTFEPVPGFLNPELDPLRVAKSTEPETWPPASQGGWRDKWDDPVDPGWIGSWNGYFGKNVFNADQELYYRCSDDLYDRFEYYPDSTDLKRRGLGILMDVRAMAWTQVLINDVVFFIHDVKNDGTRRIPKTAFLIFLADYVGGDGTDDQPFIDLQSDIAYLTDSDRVGTSAFGGDPVGVAAVKYIETPGNEVDGIDNDGDADQYPELLARIQGDPETLLPHFRDEDFRPRRLKPGDKIVLIDSLTFARIITTYPEGGGRVKSLGKVFELPPEGIELKEDTTANLLDDDLDGLIDENYSLHRWRYDEITRTEGPVRYINYLAFQPGDTLKRGFIVPGWRTPASYETVAPMVDESRDDGFDNDGDWNADNDDVGMDGVKGTGDPGEADGVPTSGAGTEFPGEPNIDKTDVSETDLIGLTSAVQIPVGDISLNTTPDRYLFQYFMSPGHFEVPRPTGEYDTFVASGFFPMEPGQRQRMAIALAIAGGGQTKAQDIASVDRKLEDAFKAYAADYQFARAPLQVTVRAVPGDGKVTLYWDDVAERSVDRYIADIGGPANDFEGYRIYRATDPAFLDAKIITDGYGVRTLLKPIAQFDLVDGIKGFDPVGFKGVHFYLGDDTGLRHVYTDSGLVNGQRYFYAVTAYDMGFPAANIAPSETPISVDVDLQGNIRLGSNVVMVRPTAKAAGYLPPEVESFEHVAGSATGSIQITVIDPSAILDGHEYEITFEDTLIRGKKSDTLTTKSFTVRDLTENRTVIDRSPRVRGGEEVPVFDGIQLKLLNEKQVALDTAKSGWNHEDVFPFAFDPVTFVGIQGEKRPNDYRILIGEVGMSTSKDTSIGFYRLRSKAVNFKVINLADGSEVPFAFAELDGNDGRLTVDPRRPDNTDVILLLEPGRGGKLVYTWQIYLVPRPGKRNPQPGDVLTIYLKKPFLSRDVYRFKIKGARLSKEKARQELEKIRVVPNPYIATVSWEPKNTYRSGRGPREIHFINLPPKCTIRIYDVSGTLIDKIEHDSPLENGTERWDVLSKENLDISYGVYIYHVDAPGIGQKTGTFAIIK
ncbi:MAG: hypothetical protein ONB23_04095 [candidate division KSB1 bacterium]|nr:hypothetical protein [candidate division KSB1 bacterium]